MPEGVEEDLKEITWRWLEQQQFRVAGEVSLQQGRIDIVGKRNDGLVGIEIKSLTTDSNRYHSEIKKMRNQLKKYARSGYLDELYLFCENPEALVDVMGGQRYDGNKSGEPVLLTPSVQQNKNIQEQIGLGQISLESDVELKRFAYDLNRYKELDLPKNNESWVIHHLYDWFDQKEAKLATREGLLPAGNMNKFIDISVFDGSTNPAEIWEDYQKKHIGVEAKGKSGLTPVTDVRKQLKTYLNSGGVTHLFLAIPHEKLDFVKQKLFSDTVQTTLDGETINRGLPDKIGLLTVDKDGNIKKEKSAERVQMKFDAAKHNGEVVPVGWGAKWTKQKSCEFTQSHRVYNN